MYYNSRTSHRLRGYDYSQGGTYFITICTYQKTCILSKIGLEESTVLELTELGRLTGDVMCELAKKHHVKIPACVIMPNHIHFLMELDKTGGITVGRFVGALKSITANRCFRQCDKMGIRAGKLWQRDYYDHIIRNEADYLEKWKYIEENPEKWILDELYGT